VTKPHVLVVSNHWCAQKHVPSAGIFVDRQVASLEKAGAKVSIFDIGTSHSAKAGIGPIPSVIHILRKWIELRRLVPVLNPDLVHGRYGTIVGIMAAFAGKPAVITYCGGDLLPGASVSSVRLFSGFLLSNLAALKAKGLICVSEELRLALWWRRSRAIVIPDGVDLDLFSPGSQETSRRQLGWELGHPIVILNVRNDPKAKGLDLATTAMQIVRSKVPTAELRLIENVEPTTMPLYYRGADALLCLSLSEGSPNVVKEALACNLPVVSTPVGDVEERLAGVQPSSVVPRDAEAIADALMQILLERKRSNGRERVFRLGLDQVAQSVLKVYRSVLTDRV
jgi:glycosyltransferase involved in cell wall biosynthesis